MTRILVLTDDIAKRTTPQSTLGKGAAYILRHWTALTRFLDHGRLPPDNYLAENLLRIVALIGKNSLFLGSPDGGERAAVTLSIFLSRSLQEIDPIDFLTAVTPHLLEHRRLHRLMLPTPDLAPWTPKANTQRTAMAREEHAA